MSAHILMDVVVLARVSSAIKDALYEIEQPEVNELVTGALERKLERALADVETALGTVAP